MVLGPLSGLVVRFDVCFAAGAAGVQLLVLAQGEGTGLAVGGVR